jgi:multiple sugar transport system permease protein
MDVTEAGRAEEARQKTRPMKAFFDGLDRKNISHWLFLGPYVILFLVFGIFPILFSIYLSFHAWNPVQGLEAMEFVGLENYQFALEDPWLWRSLKNTFFMAVLSGLPQHLVAIPLAYILVRANRWVRNFASSAYFFPYVTSSVVIALIFFNMYSPRSGIINQMIVGLSEWPLVGAIFEPLAAAMPINWLEDIDLIQYSISFVVFWKFTGFNIVIYTTGLMTVPEELYEAARIDGAGPWRRFWHISLPHLRPFILLGATLSVIGGLQLFEEPYILTRGEGGPSQAGLTIANYLMRVGWEWLQMGQASAIAWMLFAIIGVASILNYFLLNKRGE